MVAIPPVSGLSHDHVAMKPTSLLHAPHPPPSRVRLSACLHTQHYITLKSMKRSFPHIEQLLDTSATTQARYRVVPTNCAPQEKKNFLHQFLIPVAKCCTSSSHKTDSDNGDDDALPGFLNRQPQNNLSSQQHGGPVHTADHVSALDINMWLHKETGLQRLQDAFALGGVPGSGKSVFVSDDTAQVNKVVFYASIFGFTLAFINACTTHSLMDGKQPKNLSQTEGLLRGLYSEQTIPKNVLRDTLRQGGIFSLQAITLFHLPHAVAVYRNETTVWEFVISTVLAYGMPHVIGCPIKLLKSVGQGAVIGGIYGLLMTSALNSKGMTQEQRNFDRIRRYIAEERSLPETDS